MLPDLKLELVAERDIDLILFEELACGRDLLRFLALRSGLEGDWEFGERGVWHSVSHPTLGESDLVVRVQLSADRRHALLIENKIGATAQPEQAARYRLRGDAGIEKGDWESFSTCIFAPQRYLEGGGDARLYDFSFSYEEIMGPLSRAEGLDAARREHRIMILTQAVEQHRRGYAPLHDERVTDFWRSYWEQVSSLFPELGMKEPGSKPAGSDWVEFRSPMLPAGTSVWHKWATRAVDLQLPLRFDAVEQVSQACASLLGEDMSIAPTGKSCAIRVVVPALDRFKEYQEQSESALRGMKAAFRMTCLSPIICQKALDSR
jgi:hypothetical protein